MNINERIDYCAVCDEYTHGELKKEPMTETINNKIVSYIGEVLICSKCGEKMYTKEVLNYNKQASKEAYNRLIKLEKEQITEETKENPVIKCGKIGGEIVKKTIEKVKEKDKRKKWAIAGGIGAGISAMVAVIVKIVKRRK